MIKVMFVCHGNICRSPMGEYIFSELLRGRGLTEECYVSSSAVTTEEIGNDVYPPAKRVLLSHGIPCPTRAARRITPREIEEYDHILCMDQSNLRRLIAISPLAEGKAHLLGEYGLGGKEIEDPWYTGRFDRVYDQIFHCSECFLESLFGADAPSLRSK